MGTPQCWSSHEEGQEKKADCSSYTGRRSVDRGKILGIRPEQSQKSAHEVARISCRKRAMQTTGAERGSTEIEVGVPVC